MMPYDHINGCLVGTAVGDAIGLPREGLSRRRAERLCGGRPLRHRMIAGRGLCSDDTEQTVMVAQSLVAGGGELEAFRRDFARRLRWWLLRVPAGVGLGTLRACLKLWCGVSPERSGVRSAGNGPAMRSALLGLVTTSEEKLAALVRASSRITHTDPRAEQSAHIVAAIAQKIVATGGRRLNEDEVSGRILPIAGDAELRRNIVLAFEAAKQGTESDVLAERLGLGNGVTGFVVHTVPVAVHCWFAHQGNYRDTVESAVCLGGDADTVGAIAGALGGTQVGVGGIPSDWIDKLAEWPCTVEWMDVLARAVSDFDRNRGANVVPRCASSLLLIRNLAFLVIVLTHGFRRLLPPY